MSAQVSLPSSVDFLVVGAGVFGVCAAREAADRGFSVLLVDHKDYGCGASANSLKTIHGGLRYLQNGDFRSCIISAREQSLWLNLAPDLVRPLPCLMATQRNLSKHPMLVATGLYIHNLLSGKYKTAQPGTFSLPLARLISKRDFLEDLPSLSAKGVCGGALWYDAQAINTERLQMAMILRAREEGVVVANYTEIKDLSISGQGQGFEARLSITGADEHLLSAARVLDCSGSGQFLQKRFELESNIEYVQAVNLVISKRLSSMAAGVTAQTGQGQSRLLFCAPWIDGFTLIGTWYFHSDEHKAGYLAKDQLAQCVEEVNSAFSEPQIQAEDVVQVHSGLLPADKAKLANTGPDGALLKHARLIDWQKKADEFRGLYTLVGTKYTLARRGAEEALNQILGRRSPTWRPSQTRSVPLAHVNAEESELLEQLDISNRQSAYLQRYFGAGFRQIIAICESDASLREGVPGAEECIKAVVQYCIVEEDVMHLTDLVVRRLPLGNACLPPEETISYCLGVLADHHQWNSKQRASEEAGLRRCYLKQKDQI